MELRFFYCSDDMRIMWNKHNVYFSEKFCNYFSNNVRDIFQKEAGIKASYKVGLSVFKPEDVQVMYEPGIISKINTAISILPEFIDNISFCWKSKSGKIVHTYDEDFDEEDLECWIEGIKPALYWKYINTKNEDHPFKLKNLPYVLEVCGFGVNMGLQISLNEAGPAEEIVHELSAVIDRYNLNSEANQEKNMGIVHNASAEINAAEILFRLDVGSAGVAFIKKLLKALAKYPQVQKVSLDL